MFRFVSFVIVDRWIEMANKFSKRLRGGPKTITMQTIDVKAISRKFAENTFEWLKKS